MSGPYAFKSIEAIAQTAQVSSQNATGGSFINTDYHIAFDCYVENPSPQYHTDALLNIPGQDNTRNLYLHNVFAPGFLSSGILKFNEYSFFENCAMPINIGRREGLIGEPIGWGIDFATWYADQHGLETILDRSLSRNYIDLMLEELRKHTLSGQAVIMSAPGQEIYGHWLLDIIPRLHVLSLGDFDGLPIYYNNMPKWADYFLEALALDPARFQPHPARFFKVEEAIVPTASKSGYRLGETSLKAAWARILQAYSPPPMDKAQLSRKVFFSRRQLAFSARRSVPNIADIENALRDRGYAIVFPETLSIPEQIRIMREARVVIGEDGSALHNIIFSHPGMRLGVLSWPERTNLWHMGICQILGHSLAYCGLPDAGEPMSIDALNDFVDALEG
ncbi:glycosyltransferase 61 family protein [Asticcacaulis sp. EMRT-3]|uniref:glycosyltransferase family 61 protein n=1 Tax=Asticcacaulis sp. EMRT-3 TaxID=3040349 RepID=UPI0024AF3481|nr:glycosyltransferase 61 family protein [Asticcacaulis sp. EMRT-3]MDI7776356.1 glycosyltransferase 61 family protein [Asticcacaulis sp. EMRT-3]